MFLGSKTITLMATTSFLMAMVGWFMDPMRTYLVWVRGVGITERVTNFADLSEMTS